MQILRPWRIWRCVFSCFLLFTDKQNEQHQQRGSCGLNTRVPENQKAAWCQSEDIQRRWLASFGLISGNTFSSTHRWDSAVFSLKHPPTISSLLSALSWPTDVFRAHVQIQNGCIPSWTSALWTGCFLGVFPDSLPTWLAHAVENRTQKKGDSWGLRSTQLLQYRGQYLVPFATTVLAFLRSHLISWWSSVGS